MVRCSNLLKPNLWQAVDSEDFEDVKLAWANAVPDEDGVGEMTDDTSDGTSGWRRVGESIIYNEEEVIGVGSAGYLRFSRIR